MFFFQKYLARRLPLRAHRLFRTLETMRRRGTARPILVIEQGDTGLRPLLEQYMRYRVERHRALGILVSRDTVIPRHQDFLHCKPTRKPDHLRGLTADVMMMLDVQDFNPISNPLVRRGDWFEGFCRALMPMLTRYGAFVIHLRLPANYPCRKLERSRLAWLLQFTQSLDPPDPPPTKPHHKPVYAKTHPHTLLIFLITPQGVQTAETLKELRAAIISASLHPRRTRR